MAAGPHVLQSFKMANRRIQMASRHASAHQFHLFHRRSKGRIRAVAKLIP